MQGRLVLCLALALGAAGGFPSAAAARTATVRFSHPDAAGTGVTAFRIYLRQSGQSYGAPAWQGLPAASGGVYAAQVTAPDGVTVYASGTAVNASGESALSNEIALAPPAPVCGNGALESGEACDDGNQTSGDGCRSTCTIERCGDGVRDAAEACDDGNTANGDGCSATCTVERVPACGDGFLDAGEACDDGNTSAGDGCRADCTRELCGDAIRDAGEICDDGNGTNGDGCRSDCTRELCGDYRVDPQEQCDDGNRSSGDGCQSTCLLPVCGDASLDTGEQCDDGNTTLRDGCDAVCRVEVPVCGDGYSDEPEQCDDGNLAGGDGCDAACQIEPEASLLPFFMDAGGTHYTDPTNRIWVADTPFASGGTVETVPTRAIAKTELDGLYLTTRYGGETGARVKFEVPVQEPGLYTVRLHFAEVTTEASKTRPRVFDVVLEGAISIKGLEVMREVQRYEALVRSLSVNVMDGVLSVELIPQKGRPMLSGIEVHRAADTEPLPTPGRPGWTCKRCD